MAQRIKLSVEFQSRSHRFETSAAIPEIKSADDLNLVHLFKRPGVHGACTDYACGTKTIDSAERVAMDTGSHRSV